MIRLILAILLFLISLLTVFKAPTYHLWLLAIAVTEFPLFFVAMDVLILMSGFKLHKYQWPVTIVSAISLLLFLSPIVRSYRVAGSLQKELDISLGTSSASVSDTPFSFGKMLSPILSLPYSTLTYTSYPGVQLDLDFYRARATGKRPCIIVIHGGAWSSGDSKQLPELNSYLANAGYNVASVNYRMAPQYQSPLPVEDVKNAIGYLYANADSLNIDTNKLVLLGRSAGAQIALLAAYTLKHAGIRGVIDFYGPADMVWGYSAPASPWVMDSRTVMESYLGGPYNAMPKNYFDSSPLEFINKNSPPTLIIHGQNDVLVAYDHSRRLNEKLQKYGIKHYWLKLPWATHGFDFNVRGPGGQLSTYAVRRFLENVTTN